MRKNKSKGTRMRANRPAKPFRSGIVVVHGVGNQKRGATVEHVAERIDATLHEVGITAELVDEATGGADEPRTRQIVFGDAHSVLIAEAYWSDIVRDHREKGWLAAISRVWFIVSVLPYLMSAALAPRAHEMKKLTARWASTQSSKHRGFDSDVDELVEQAPTMWRGITAITVVLVVALAFAAWPTWVVILITVGAVGLLLLLTRSPWDVIEHVRIAGLARSQLDTVLGRVGDTIDHVANRCDEVWVVGHSQGGYIAHRALSKHAARWPGVRRFSGVASGLRPISLIAAASNRWWIVSGWLWSGATVLFTIGVISMFEPGGPFNTEGSRSFINTALVLFAQGPLALADPARATALGQIFAAAGSSLMPTRWAWLVCLVSGVVLIIVAAFLQRRGGAGLAEIAPLPDRVTWDEISSPSDLVGSMSVPELPTGVVERTMPSLRQPVLDHLLTSYLGRRSMFRFEIARWLSRSDRRSRRFAGLDACTSELTELAERTYRLRMTVQLIFLVFAVVLPAVLGASLLTAASTVLWIGIALAGATGVIAGSWWMIASRRRVRRFLRDVADGASAAPAHAWRRVRPRWSPRILMLTALISALGGWGCYLLAALQESTGAVALQSVITALRETGLTLIGVVPLVLVAFCLVVLGLRGVRAICGVCILVLINGMGLLIRTDAPWAAQGWPGSIPLVAAIAMVGAAILWSRPRTTAIDDQS